MRESKECAECGGIYYRPEYMANDRQWEARKYCSVACAMQGLQKANKARKEQLALEGVEVSEMVPEGEPELAPPAQKLPVMRELKIVRIGPNPRALVCEYYELAERRTCVVFVKNTSKFVRGMRLQIEEPANEADFVRPWVYTGPPPKHRGRW